jgi:hypothetical protein
MTFVNTGNNAPLVKDEVEEAVDILYDVGQWAWNQGVEVLDELWNPFGNNVNKWLGEMQHLVVPVMGKSNPDDIKQMWDYLYGMHGESASDMFAPSGSNPLEDGLGLYVIYEDEKAEKKGKETLGQYGLASPVIPNMIVPMGLYLDDTPYDIPNVDTAKYNIGNTKTRRRFDAMNEGFESIYSPIFYAPQWELGQAGTKWANKYQMNRGNVENPELRYADVPNPETDAGLSRGNPNFGRNLPSMATPDYEEQARDLAVVMAMQENDGAGYDDGWGDPTVKYNGAYQFSENDWAYWSNDLYGEPVTGKPNPDVQDAVAEHKFKFFLEKYDGDIGAVAAEHYAGIPAKIRFYDKGIDFTHGKPNSEHPTMMEYVSYINRSYLNYLNTKQSSGTGSVVKGEGLPSVTGANYARTKEERLAYELPDTNFLDKNRGLR